MIIERIYKNQDMLSVVVDAFPDIHPTWSIHDLTNGSQLVDKLKDRLREIIADPQIPPGDPNAQKFEHLKQEVTGLDIGEL